MSKQQTAALHAALAGAAVIVALFLAWLAGALTNHTVSLPFLDAGAVPVVAFILVYVAHLLAPQDVPAPVPPVAPPAPVNPPPPPPAV